MTVVRLPDGTWLMLAAYSIDLAFNPKGASSNSTPPAWATSPRRIISHHASCGESRRPVR